MTFFKFPKGEKIHPSGSKKILPAKEYATLLSATKLLNETKEAAEKQCQEIKEKAKEEGFSEGLSKWTDQLAQLEKEVKALQEEIQEAVVSLAMTAVKKIIGMEIEVKPKTVVDIVTTALKPVIEHRKIAIYVNRQDFEKIEESRPKIKKLFEYLETLKIEIREDVTPGGCIIETEAGIINAELENQFNALEKAFKAFVTKRKKKTSEE